MYSLAAKHRIKQTALMHLPHRNKTLSKIHSQLILLSLALLPVISAAQTAPPDSPPDLTSIIRRQISWDDALPGSKNPTGLHLKFTKISDTPSPTGRLVRYRAYVRGASQQQKFTLGVWKIGSDLQILPVDVYVNAKGLLMAHKPRPDEENSDSLTDGNELDLATQAAPGEPVRWVFTTHDGSLMVPGTTVPFPIQGKGATCRIELRLVEPEGQAILIYADGLPPNTVVPFQTASAGVSKPAQFTVNNRGHAATISFPYIDGKNTGALKVTIAAKDCSTSAEIPWGKGTYHPSK
jgi:hypothetical protein